MRTPPNSSCRSRWVWVPRGEARKAGAGGWSGFDLPCVFLVVFTALLAHEDARAVPTDDTDRFVALLDEVGPRLFAYIRLFESNHADAEDVREATVERAFRAWRSGRRPTGAPLHWFLLIGRRLLIDRARRRRIAAIFRADGLQPQADESLRESEERMWFRQLATVLPRRQFEAIVLRYLFDVGDIELGRLLGLSPSAARTLIARAVARLRMHPELLK